MRHVILPALVLAVCTFGCERTSEPTASELASALGMRSWQVQMPQELSEDALVSVVVQCADGTEVGRRSGSTGVRAGEIVRVFLWQDDDREMTRYAVVTSRQTWHSALRDPFPVDLRTFNFTDRISSPGDFLMKTSEGDSVSSDNALRQGECGWTVAVEQR